MRRSLVLLSIVLASLITTFVANSTAAQSEDGGWYPTKVSFRTKDTLPAGTRVFIKTAGKGNAGQILLGHIRKNENVILKRFTFTDREAIHEFELTSRDQLTIVVNSSEGESLTPSDLKKFMTYYKLEFNGGRTALDVRVETSR